MSSNADIFRGSIAYSCIKSIFSEPTVTKGCCCSGSADSRFATKRMEQTTKLKDTAMIVNTLDLLICEG